MLKKILINGLRGFGEEEIINFSLPDKKNGSGLNIIVGPNNSGKTTIIEAIKFFNSEKSNISFSEGKRNIRNNNRIDILYYDENDKKSEIHTVDTGGSQVNTIGVLDINKVPYILPSRRYVDYNMHNSSFFSDRKTYAINLINTTKNRTSNLNQFEQRIFKWQNNKNEFDKILKKIIVEDFNWNIEQNDEGAYSIKIIFSDMSISHTREGIGDGYWSIFTIVDSLYDSKVNDLIVIDEPELSLHPAFQKRVINLLLEFSKDRQIIITTHSPYFISLEAIINGGGLIRTYKNNDGNIKTGILTNEDRKFIKSLVTNLNNPHILGLEAKELFFIEDNVIITEGQEDVVIIPNICSELGVELKATLFGWGAGGAENILKVLKMLSNLGYQKVTAIFDGDKKELYKICYDTFTQYNIKILFKDDIRDKDEVHKKSKNGITTRSGKIKEENKKEFLKLLKEINYYHQNNLEKNCKNNRQ